MTRIRILNLAAVALLTAACSSGSGESASCATLIGDRTLAGNSTLAGGFQSPRQVVLETRFVAVDVDNVDSLGIDFPQLAMLMLDDGGDPGGRAVTNAPIALDSNALGGPDDRAYLVPRNHQADSFLGFVNENFTPAFGAVKIFMQLQGTAASQCIEFDAATFSATSGYPGLTNMNLPPRDPGLAGDSLAWRGLDSAQTDQLLQTVGNDADNQILDAPILTVLNNQRAIVMVDDLQPILSNLDPDFRDLVEQNTTNPLGIFTGPTLDVRPFVTGDGNIRLEIRVGTRAASFFRSVAFDVNGTQADHEVPVVEPSRLMTTVTVPDGNTVALGGLLRQGETDVETGVPLLGDLPVIGNLFGTGRIGPDQTTLLVLVTPRVVIQEE